MAYPPIFYAVRALDVEALRREIAAGGDPDMVHGGGAGLTPLYYAACWHSGSPGEQIRERLECISVLLEAGASVDKLVCGATPLYHAVVSSPTAVVEALVEAGADVNWAEQVHGVSVLDCAATCCTAAAVRLLISAGAVDFDRALDLAITNGKRRNCAQLIRAGAALPAVLPSNPPIQREAIFFQTRAYIENIRAAGGYQAYEKAHRQRLVAIYLPKFPKLPAEMLERIVIYSYESVGH